MSCITDDSYASLLTHDMFLMLEMFIYFHLYIGNYMSMKNKVKILPCIKL